jgi:hypothetical protein
VRVHAVRSSQFHRAVRGSAWTLASCPRAAQSALIGRVTPGTFGASSTSIVTPCPLAPMFFTIRTRVRFESWFCRINYKQSPAATQSSGTPGFPADLQKSGLTLAFAALIAPASPAASAPTTISLKDVWASRIGGGIQDNAICGVCMNFEVRW